MIRPGNQIGFSEDNCGSKQCSRSAECLLRCSLQKNHPQNDGRSVHPDLEPSSSLESFEEDEVNEVCKMTESSASHSDGRFGDRCFIESKNNCPTSTCVNCSCWRKPDILTITKNPKQPRPYQALPSSPPQRSYLSKSKLLKGMSVLRKALLISLASLDLYTLWPSFMVYLQSAMNAPSKRTSEAHIEEFLLLTNIKRAVVSHFSHHESLCLPGDVYDLYHSNSLDGDVLDGTTDWRRCGEKIIWNEILFALFVGVLGVHYALELWQMAKPFVSTVIVLKHPDDKKKQKNIDGNFSVGSGRVEMTYCCKRITLICYVVIILLHLLSLPLIKTPIDEPFLVKGQELRYFGSVGGLATFKMLSIIELLFAKTVGWVRTKLRGKLVTTAVRISGFALRNPSTFVSRFNRTLTALRWVKFLAPLIGTCNKLVGRAKDFANKRMQRRNSTAARQAWRRLMKTMTHHEKLEAAAIKVQKTFRSKSDRVALKVIESIQSKKETRALSAKAEVFRSQETTGVEKSQETEECRVQLSDAERLLIANIEASILQEAKIKRRMKLLRPNTTFSVIWRFVTVTCTLIEIAQLTVAPAIYSGELKKMPLDKLLEEILLPASHNSTVIGEKDSEKKSEFVSWLVTTCTTEFSTYGTATSPFAHRRTDIISHQWMRLWNIVATKFIDNFVSIVGVTCFLDVFVTFFTGELDPKSGALVPKPTFQRWILPGVALQLLVNPAMQNMAKILKAFAHALRSIGTFRFLHAALPLMHVASFVVDTMFLFAVRLFEGMR